MRLFLLSLVVASAVHVTPVQKVIELLSDTLAKGKEEKHQEQVAFAAYKQFCDDTSEEKNTAIKEANQRITSLKAAIQNHESEAARLGREIAGHNSDVAAWQGDLKAAKKVRDIERTDYQALHKDYSESIDALERAIVVLKKQTPDTRQVLLEIKQLPLVPAKTRKALDFFLQSADIDYTAPEANAYEFQSGGIIEMLEKLNTKFQDEKYEAEKSEANSKHAHQMLVQDLDSQVATAKQAVADKTVERSNHKESSAAAKGDLNDTITTRDDDQTYLDDLVSTCSVKSSDFEQRQQLRSEEIEAIEKAISILSSDDVSGSAQKHLPTLSQVSLLQTRKDINQSPIQQRVAAFISERAEKLHSHVLSALAIRAAEDPFGKVKKMIQDLIVRLQEEANAEAEHKGWCDKELAQNKLTKEEKTRDSERLSADKDSLESAIAKNHRRVQELNTQLADLAATLKKATELRAADHEKNTATIADSVAAQTAVARATEVLKDFYAKAGQAVAMVQEPADAPASWDTPYTGMQSENGGIIGMLEVIMSDFARLETETKAAEQTAQDDFNKLKNDTEVDTAKKTKDVEHLENTIQSDKQKLTETTEDLQLTNKELNSALEYYEKLKPSCVDAGVSYEDRVARRKEEIESLKEALKVLSGEDI